MSGGQGPLRTCIGCRQVKPKEHLVRLVKTDTGETAVDPNKVGKGRGMYLCPARECWELGLRQKRLAGPKWPEIGTNNRASLLAFSSNLPRRCEPAEEAKAKAKKELHIGS